jgi:hypothetical protein
VYPNQSQAVIFESYMTSFAAAFFFVILMLSYHFFVRGSRQTDLSVPSAGNPRHPHSL